ncbi:MAG: PKD domain-containing protein, partial [Thermoplasmatales archaeon]|nr:PKD domain-containing protein [Thermoplasmatales archaeon]
YSWGYYWDTYNVDDGYYTISAKAYDFSGITDSASIHVTVDNHPPTTIHNLTGIPGENNWWQSNVTVTLNATDTATGVKYTKYRLNGGNWEDYTVSFNITEEGIHTLEYYSADNADNAESVKGVFTIKIDKTLPIGWIIINEGREYTNSTEVILYLSSLDRVSNVSKMCFRNESYGWTEWEDFDIFKTWNLTPGDGNKKVWVKYRNYAGLVSDAYNDTIILDSVPPVADAGDDQIVVTGATVMFDGTGSYDPMPGSGIANYTWVFMNGTGSLIMLYTATPTYTFNYPGNYTVTLNVMDNAGGIGSDTVNVTVGPDMTIGSDDIVFSNPAPVEDETVYVNATVWNIGGEDVSDIFVEFYDGDPETTGTLITYSGNATPKSVGADDTTNSNLIDIQTDNGNPATLTGYYEVPKAVGT